MGSGISASEHHALISRAERVVTLTARLHLGRGIHAERNVGGLPVHKRNDAALIICEIAAVIADLTDDAARNFLIVDLRAAGHFSCQKQGVIGSTALDRRTGSGILPHKLVQDGVSDAVTDFIGVTFRHALTRKISSHSPLIIIWQYKKVNRFRSASGCFFRADMIYFFP